MALSLSPKNLIHTLFKKGYLYQLGCVLIKYSIEYSMTHMENYENLNLIVCLLNMILTVICIYPLFVSITQILMQGKSSLFECFYSNLQKNVSLFEGVLAIHHIKFWMVAQNESKCYIKLLVDSKIESQKLKSYIDSLVTEIGINIDVLIDTAISS